LHYLRRDDTLDATWSQHELGSILHEPEHGPLFVTTTTVSSVLKGPDWGLGSYWGWRLGTLRRVGPGFDPVDLGYPATREMLDALAERPEKWNPGHAEFGVFSYPSYHLDANIASDAPTGPATTMTWSLSSRLLVPIDLVLPFSLAAGHLDQIEVDGGTVLRSRSVDGVTDLWVAVTLPAGGTATVSSVAS